MDFHHFTCRQVCSSAFTTVELRSSLTETTYFTIFCGIPWICHSKRMEYHGYCRHFISLCCKARHESWGTTSPVSPPLFSETLGGAKMKFNRLICMQPMQLCAMMSCLSCVYCWHLLHFACCTTRDSTSISANADGPRDAASRKIDHIALSTNYNNQTMRVGR